MQELPPHLQRLVAESKEAFRQTEAAKAAIPSHLQKTLTDTARLMQERAREVENIRSRRESLETRRMVPVGEILPPFKSNLAELRELLTELVAKPPKPRQKKRHRQTDTIPPLTEKQAEAVQIVCECKGSIAEAGRRIGKDPKTIRQHYNAGMAKLGQAGCKRKKTVRLMAGSRGEDEVATHDDKRARHRPTDKR